MKHIAYLLSIIIFISSCDNKKKMREQQTHDSIAQVEKDKLDSIENIHLDSLIMIAWGDAQFGMSMKEALKTKALKNCKVDGNELSFPTENLNIANNTVDIKSFRIFFENDELKEILISSSSQYANRLNDLENDARNIAYEFQKKYGKPTYSFDEQVSINDFDDDLLEIKGWNMKSYEKTINVYLGRKNENKYFYLISIENSNFPTKKSKRIYTEKEKKQIRERKEREEQEKYQF